MTTPDWNELERLWQSSGATAAPALDVIAKQRRRAWYARLLAIFETVLVVLGVALGAWTMTLGTAQRLIAGGGVILLTLFAGGFSLWARWLPPISAEDSVADALDAAITRAQVSVRWWLAAFWVIAASLFFSALMAFVWASLTDYPPGSVKVVLITFGIAMTWAAIWQVLSIVYYQRRVRELGDLEEVKRALAAGE